MNRLFAAVSWLILQPAIVQAQSTPTNASAEAAIQQLGNAFVQEKTHLGLSVGIVLGGQKSFYNFGTTKKDKLQEALAIFKLNVSLYPKGYNTYDSQTETYERIGNRKLAIDNYTRSLALNPQNSNATEFLEKNGGSK